MTKITFKKMYETFMDASKKAYLLGYMGNDTSFINRIRGEISWHSCHNNVKAEQEKSFWKLFFND